MQELNEALLLLREHLLQNASDDHKAAIVDTMFMRYLIDQNISAKGGTKVQDLPPKVVKYFKGEYPYMNG